MPPTVWIANEAGHAYERARAIAGQDAEFRPLTLGSVNPLRVDRLNWHIARGIVRFVGPDDYLLISGTPMVNASALLLWLLQFGRCRILQWNAAKREYELTTIDLDDVRSLLDRELQRA